jgi:hypothetical protein
MGRISGQLQRPQMWKAEYKAHWLQIPRTTLRKELPGNM